MNILPVNGTLPIALPPGAPSSASATPLPQDFVLLSARPTRAAKPPVYQAPEEAAPSPAPSPLEIPRTLTMSQPVPAPESQDESFRLAMGRVRRRHDINTLLALQSDLEAGKLQDKAFQAAAKTVLDHAHGSPDFFTRRIGRLVLYDRFSWKNSDVLLDIRMKEGDHDFVRRYFHRMSGQIVGHAAAHTGEHVGKVLDLAASLEPDQEIALGVAQFAHDFAQRSKMTLNEEIRTKESPQLDLELAASARDVLLLWNQQGLLEIRGNLEDLSENQPVVRDGVPPVLDLTPRGEKPAWPGSEQLSRELGAYNDPEKIARGIQGLIKMGPPGVALLVARASHSDGTYDDYRMLSNTLAAARENLQLKAWLEPHLPTLRHHVRNHFNQNSLCPGNLEGEGNASVVEQLTGTFPEIVTPEYFCSEVMGLALSDEINTAYRGVDIAQKLWKDRPELRDLGMRCAIELPDHEQRFHLDFPVHKLLRAAAKDGWEPTGDQQDWLVSWLYILPSREKLYLHSSDSYKSALAAVAAQEPQSLASFELPDRQGQMVPMTLALLSQVAAAENLEDNLKALLHGQNELAATIRNQTSPETAALLYDQLQQEYQKAGSLAKLDSAGRVRLAAVSLLGKDEQLGKLLARESLSDDRVFKPLLDRVLREPSRERLMEQLGREDLTASDIVRIGTEALKLSLPIGSTQVTETQARMASALAHTTPIARGEQGTRLIRTLTEELAGAGHQRDVPWETLARLAALAPLLRSDGELRRNVGELLEHVKRIADQGWEDKWKSVDTSLGAALSAGFAEEIQAAADPGPLLDEAIARLQGYKSGQLHTLVRAWHERLQKPRAQPYGTPHAFLENGMLAVRRPNMRAAWLEEAARPQDGSVSDFCRSKLVKPMLRGELKALCRPGRSFATRAAHLAVAEGLAGMTYLRGQDPVGRAFGLYAADWEKELLETVTGSRRELLSPLYSAVVAANGEKAENWDLVKPLLARYPAESWDNLTAALTECRLPYESFREQWNHYSYIAGRLGPDEAEAGVQVFRNYNLLREEGLEHEAALNQALREYLNPGAGDVTPARSGVDENAASVNIGGIMVRKRR